MWVNIPYKDPMGIDCNWILHQDGPWWRVVRHLRGEYDACAGSKDAQILGWKLPSLKLTTVLSFWVSAYFRDYVSFRECNWLVRCLMGYPWCIVEIQNAGSTGEDAGETKSECQWLFTAVRLIYKCLMKWSISKPEETFKVVKVEALTAAFLVCRT